MNSFLRTQLMGYAAPSIDVANLSADEAELMSLDAQDHVGKLEAELAALNRLQDQAMNAEDLVLIASHIKEAKNTDLALVDNSLNQLGAGEGVTGDDLIPNMQSYEGQALNMQSLKDVASSVWQAIKDLVERIRVRIVKFFKSRWGDSAKLRKRLKSLIERTEKMAGKAIDEAKTEIGREIKYLTFEGKVEGNGKDVHAAIGNYNTLASGLYETWIKEVNAFGSELETAFASWDASAQSSNGPLTTLNTKAEQLKLTSVRGLDKLFKATASGDNRSPDGVTRKSMALAGNVNVFAADAFNASGTVYEKAKVLAKSRVTIEPYLPKPKDLEEKGEISTWSVDEVRTMCNELLSVLDIIDRYDDSKYMKDVEKQMDKVTKAGDKVATARSKQEDIKEEVNADAVAMQQYASAYASWTSNGLASFASNFNSFANGVAVVAAKCLSNHK